MYLFLLFRRVAVFKSRLVDFQCHTTLRPDPDIRETNRILLESTWGYKLLAFDRQWQLEIRQDNSLVSIWMLFQHQRSKAETMGFSTGRGSSNVICLFVWRTVLIFHQPIFDVNVLNDVMFCPVRYVIIWTE